MEQTSDSLTKTARRFCLRDC